MVEALAAILKPNSNYVITFTNNILPQDETMVKSIIKSALAPRHTSSESSRDVLWTKVIVQNIPVTNSFGSLRSRPPSPLTSRRTLFSGTLSSPRLQDGSTHLNEWKARLPQLSHSPLKTNPTSSPSFSNTTSLPSVLKPEYYV